jgi:hypothetical protein
MVETPYVSEEAERLARSWEERFTELPPTAGVLFASVRPKPASRGEVRAFDVRIGISKKLGQELGSAIARHVLARELADERYELVIESWSGLPCAAHHAGAGADPS